MENEDRKFSDILSSLEEKIQDPHMKGVIGKIQEACYLEELGIETNPTCSQILQSCIEVAAQLNMPTDQWQEIADFYEQYKEIKE